MHVALMCERVLEKVIAASQGGNLFIVVGGGDRGAGVTGGATIGDRELRGVVERNGLAGVFERGTCGDRCDATRAARGLWHPRSDITGGNTGGNERNERPRRRCNRRRGGNVRRGNFKRAGG